MFLSASIKNKEREIEKDVPIEAGNTGNKMMKKWRYIREARPQILSPEKGEKERCSGSYCQAVGFLVIKDDSISERPG